MPKASKKSKIPEGFDKIEPTLNKLLAKLKESQAKSLKTTNKNESLWPIYQINHQISRYVYSLYYERKTILSELYQYLLKQKYVNKDLIAKWKKQGYEKLCCINCIIVNEKNNENTCICRVPRKQLEDDGKDFDRCITCGCKGCSSID